jgi:hypothetical protein
MKDAAPALWLVIATAAASGLLASIVGHALLGLPLVKVKVRHDLHIDETGPRVDSYAVVTNVRGRAVTIEEVLLLRRDFSSHIGAGRPAGWAFPVGLSEGEILKRTFDRTSDPNAMAFAMDSAGHIWPRRRWLRVKWRALIGVGMIGWPWQRNGPTNQQIARAVERTKETRPRERARAALRRPPWRRITSAFG